MTPIRRFCTALLALATLSASASAQSSSAPEIYGTQTALESIIANLVTNAIQLGRAQGNGNMPAGLLTGRDAQNVAAYIAAVAGQAEGVQTDLGTASSS